METRGNNRFISFFEKDKTKRSEKVTYLGIIFFLIVGMIAIPIVAFFAYNKDPKIGFNINSTVLIVLVLVSEIYLFFEIMYFHREYKKLKS